ncbi:MAG: DUF4417 domain-containing protein [Bifidobacteriaceae bacterium]|nr:DUF4417 domain-containing protein [Bifidobacteriaceae bacterium]
MKSEAFRSEPLFLRNRQFMVGRFQMPFVYAQMVRTDDLELLGFDKTRRIELSRVRKSKTVHFFLDDYKFDEVWKAPDKQIRKLGQYAQSLSPDFSVYSDMPEPLQMYSTFRNRWCAAVWQAAGMIVVPTVSWGGENTFEFCFDGIEKGSIVAVSTIGTARYVDEFLGGFRQLCDRIEPRMVINYGEAYPKMLDLATVMTVPYTHGSYQGVD